MREEDEENSSTTDTTELVAPNQKRAKRIEKHRNANVIALKQIHGNKAPTLSVIGASEQERTLIADCVKQLFGESIQTSFEVLPEGTHGLKQNLDESIQKGISRFESRVKKWEPTATQIRQANSDESKVRHILICAPKEFDGKSEDPVNYFAGIHAMCLHADANVHHLLPIEIDRRTKEQNLQHFVHRTQSALLDVFMAHSGVVLGT